MQTLENRVIDKKYKLRKMLGEGGMGSVWLATHRGTGRPVALKLIVPRFMANEEFLIRFQREARAAGRLRHPNIVDVTDFGFADTEQGRVAYLVMEHLQGAPLSAVLKEEKQLPLSWVADIFEQVCLAVDFAHRHGVIHRDLKPDNIWLTTNDRGGFTVKVLDFGLARLEASDDDDDADLAAYTGNEMTTPNGNGVASLAANELHTLTEGDLNTFFDKFESKISVLNLPERTALAEIFAANTMPVANGNGQLSTTHNPNAATIIGSPDAGNLPPTIIGSPDAGNLPPTILNHAEPPVLADTYLAATFVDAPAPVNGLAATIIDGGPGAPMVDDGLAATIIDATPNGATSQPAPPSSPALTQAGAIMGTPSYMSPEQCRGVSVGMESDIYSLGVIAYEMMTGQLPFNGNMIEVIKHHLATEAPPLRKANRRVPKQMARVVMSALAKSPDQRPPTGEAFASMLRAANEGKMRLLQRALTTYAEFFPKLLLASVLLNLPTLLLIFGGLVSLALLDELVPQAANTAWPDRVTTLLALLLLIWIFIEFALSMALMTRLMAQFILAPLKPMRLRAALSSVKKRLPALLFGVFLVGLASLPTVLIGVDFLTWLVLVATSLTFPAIMVEGLGGWAGLRRGMSLGRRVWGTLLLALLLQFGLPMLLELILGVDSLALFIGIFSMPLVTTMLALAYLKARQLGGEPMDEVLASFEAVENLHSAWQARLHSNLQASTITKASVAKNPNGNSRYAAPSLRAAPH